VLMSSVALRAYPVLTHEKLVALAWTSELHPLMLHRLPALTEGQIEEAHTYAYGGSSIHDVGHYPFGSSQSVTWFTTFLSRTLFLSYFIRAKAANETLAR